MHEANGFDPSLPINKVAENLTPKNFKVFCKFGMDGLNLANTRGGHPTPGQPATGCRQFNSMKSTQIGRFQGNNFST